MSRHAEHMPIQAPETPEERRSKNLSGVFDKKGAGTGWKRLKELNPSDIAVGDELPDLDPRDLISIGDELPDLDPKDLEKVEEPVDVTTSALDADAVDEAFGWLAEGDKKRAMKGRVADYREKLKKAEEDKKRTVEGRIAEREANIARLKEEKVGYEAATLAIEDQSARRLEGIRKGSRANAAAEEKAFEEHAKPLRERVRTATRETAREIVGEERGESQIEAQIERSESGEVRGLKNIPLVEPRVVYRAMAGRMESLKNETLRLLQQPSDRQRDARLQEIESESAEWMSMYRDVKMIEDAGGDMDAPRIHNRFYHQIETLPAVGIDKVDRETLAITPEKAMEERLEQLKKQDETLNRLLQESSELLWSFDDSENEKEVERAADLSKFLRDADAFDRRQKESLTERIEFLHSLEDSDHLDTRSQKLSLLIQRMDSLAKIFRSRMNRKEDNEVIGRLRDAVDSVEKNSASFHANLESWRNHPVRMEAIESRAKELEEKIRSLESARDRLSFSSGDFETVLTLSHTMAEKIEARRTSVKEVRDRIHQLANQKVRNADERAAIISERVDRELKVLPIEVDLELLDESVNGVDVDLTKMNELVEEEKKTKKQKKAA
jgi:hypothetical protein